MRTVESARVLRSRVTGRLRPRRQRLSTPAVLLVSVVLSLASVLGLPPGNPIRIVGGLGLFIGLPGIGVELALVRYHLQASPWERLAVIAGLGLAASGLVSLLLVATGTPITVLSVGAACASISVFGSVVSLIGHPRRPNKQRLFPPMRFALALFVIISGSVIGSTMGTHEGADPFTILALEDPLHAAEAMQAVAAHGGEAAVDITVESHELGPEEYQLSVVGQSNASIFSLQPSEHRVMQVEISHSPANSIEIQLWKSGRLYRSLRLTGPDPSRP